MPPKRRGQSCHKLMFLQEHKNRLVFWNLEVRKTYSWRPPLWAQGSLPPTPEQPQAGLSSSVTCHKVGLLTQAAPELRAEDFLGGSPGALSELMVY